MHDKKTNGTQAGRTAGLIGIRIGAANTSAADETADEAEVTRFVLNGPDWCQIIDVTTDDIGPEEFDCCYSPEYCGCDCDCCLC